MTLLCVDEEPHQPRRVFFEDVFVFRIDALVLADEAVELLAFHLCATGEEAERQARLLFLIE